MAIGNFSSYGQNGRKTRSTTKLKLNKAQKVINNYKRKPNLIN